MAVKLSVNLNAVAVLRNRRNLPWPNIKNIGHIALTAGAAGLTVHPRPDERHIRFADLRDIRCLINSTFPAAEFNIEGYPSDRFLDLAEKYADQITLVPDHPTQSTSDHGWDFAHDAEFLAPIIQRLKDKKIRVSLFANPLVDGLDIAKTIGADRVEFYTGLYGNACQEKTKQGQELDKLTLAAKRAKELQLGVNAGHDLTISNLPALIKRISWLDEVSIGHGLIADALEYGMHKTVQRFIRLLS
ncbi:pyridoxine 5'-phosphate synthase [Bartonella quintana]|uniref:Pyridoxine 5'-phosphate synthase n=3 Tax=Bartonella quintana TaxID=803 RepID=A0A0H3LUI0_BARQU|nr:pyridoxine 5'-phosphate synthase [Bartonella quintana]ETS13254.1 pyridoxine 5'-phosphate synthase [Bartonella quintana BQ2-D70]ETS14089.1 pyridoxine 5'-phosphate synthase [Bartonella quintana JK 73rel]ETS15776.1 pyridoxine 5'-phosphate synthase [Bartonella quintana JK 73]ETS17779.1 pyridoxine 5'-phosphate synthase [Bartonella quintana JK 7]ETS18608.1 pyridoxine 5'-phosphate synthase [Bartonella quintana JK 12]